MHDFQTRYARFLNQLDRQNLDGFIVAHKPNLAYLFNFTGSAGLACCLDGETHLLVDSRYLEHAQTMALNCTPLLIRGSFEDTLEKHLKEHLRFRGSRKRLGLETSHLSCAFWLRINTWEIATEWVPSQNLVENLRIIKETSEIKLLTRAFNMTQNSYHCFLKQVSPGMKEVHMAGILEMELRKAGGEGIAFDTIIASGPRSSLPHGVATDRFWGKDEILLTDFGLRFQNYLSDLTRVYWPTGIKQSQLYRIVSEAQHAAIESVRPGILSSEVDLAARQIIQQHGYGDNFQHSVGHGLGLEVHELPQISPRQSCELKPGMVFTVEPGIYIPGKMGIRIEDVVMVTAKGYQLLSDPDR